MLPLDTTIRAEYEDGFILDETELGDANPYGEGNTFTAVLNGQPEAEHGALVKFSAFWKNARYDVDWTQLPDNARPIRYRHGYIVQMGPNAGESGWTGIDFGYQYNDEDGKNHEVKEEIR